MTAEQIQKLTQHTTQPILQTAALSLTQADSQQSGCPFCATQQGAEQGTSGVPLETAPEMQQLCPLCQTLVQAVQQHPERVKAIWLQYQDEAILPASSASAIQRINSEFELPEVLDGKRYRAVDRDRNKWYLSVSELDGKPVEIFASTAFDRDHELQSRISNLTTITRLISLILRHIFLGEPLTLAKCLKQIQRSSRQKNDLPDMLYGVLNRYKRPGD